MRFLIFALIFAVLFAVAFKWIYLAFKKAEKVESKKWNEINDRLDNEGKNESIKNKAKKK